MINLHNMDCMVAMAEMEDNAFDLAIVDPPYGLPDRSGQGAGKLKGRIIQGMHKKGWDIVPKEEYFEELFRVSKNQIIWGGNYFTLPPTRGFVIWDKQQPFPNFSACEFAWTSFDTVSKIYVEATTRTGEKKIHPTQKSAKLYQWLLKNYAKQGDKILDTHLGSGSIALACHDMGFDLECYEIDEEYYNGAVKRLKKHQQQMRMF